MTKRWNILCIVLAVALVVALCLGGAACAVASVQVSVTAQHALLIDGDSGEELFSKAADERLYPASTTKLLTGLVVLERANLDDVVTCGGEVTAFGSQSSLMHLSDGEKITVRDLFYGMMLVSGNDAAAALAVHVGGSISGFAELMNQTAGELGLTNSHFANPHGVQNENHYTTARDMAKVARAAHANETFMEIMGTSQYTTAATNTADARTLNNTNKLVSTLDANAKYHYDYADGMKTGMTPVALNCLVSSAAKDGVSLIALLYEDDSENGVNRWTDSVALFEAGFAAVAAGAQAGDVDLAQVLSQKSVAATIQDGGAALALKPAFDSAQLSGVPASVQRSIAADLNGVTVTTQLTRALDDSVKAGDEVGAATYTYDGQTIATATLVAAQDVSAVRVTGSQGASPWLIILLIALVAFLLWFVIGMVRAARERKRAARRRAARRDAMRK